MKKIKFRNGFHAPKGVTAEAAEQELLRIKTKNGGQLRAEYILKESRQKKSLLHNYFEWDNSIAGEEYRKMQARQLTSALIFYYDEPEKITEHRVFISYRPSDEQGRYYEEIETVIAEIDIFEEARKDLNTRINAAIASYNSLVELYEQHYKNSDLKKIKSVGLQLLKVADLL